MDGLNPQHMWEMLTDLSENDPEQYAKFMKETMTTSWTQYTTWMKQPRMVPLQKFNDKMFLFVCFYFKLINQIL